MKNTTKKILSMLLAVIMLLSVMPVAYAEEASIKDIFIDKKKMPNFVEMKKGFTFFLKCVKMYKSYDKWRFIYDINWWQFCNELECLLPIFSLARANVPGCFLHFSSSFSLFISSLSAVCRYS